MGEHARPPWRQDGAKWRQGKTPRKSRPRADSRAGPPSPPQLRPDRTYPLADKERTFMADPRSERQKAVETALTQIERQFGKGSIMRLGQRETFAIESISTGSISIDHAIGIGGLPCGRVVEIYGPESSGKTTLALSVVAQAQKRGGIAAYIDAEHALDAEYARKLGVDIDNMLVSQPDSGEQALEIAEMLVRSNAVDVVVIDSVAALVPKAELEGEMGDSHVGLQARLMSQALRKLTAIVAKSRTCLIFINQIREKIGVMFGNPETTTGGRALKFYASVRIDIRRIASLKEGEEVIGSRAKVKVVKNKVAAPFRQAEFDIEYSEGISKTGEIVDLGVEHKLVIKSGAWYAYGDMRLGQGRENAKQFLRDNPDLSYEIELKLREKLGMPVPGGPRDAAVALAGATAASGAPGAATAGATAQAATRQGSARDGSAGERIAPTGRGARPDRLLLPPRLSGGFEGHEGLGRGEAEPGVGAGSEEEIGVDALAEAVEILDVAAGAEPGMEHRVEQGLVAHGVDADQALEPLDRFAPARGVGIARRQLAFQLGNAAGVERPVLAVQAGDLLPVDPGDLLLPPGDGEGRQGNALTRALGHREIRSGIGGRSHAGSGPPPFVPGRLAQGSREREGEGLLRGSHDLEVVDERVVGAPHRRAMEPAKLEREGRIVERREAQCLLPIDLEQALERPRPVEAGQRVDQPPARVEHVVDAVAGDRALQRPPVAEVDGHLRHRPLRAPVQDEALAQQARHLLVAVEHRAEEAAVGAAHLLVEAPQQPQRQDGPAGAPGRRPGPPEVGVPEEPARRAVVLGADLVEPLAEAGLVHRVLGLCREQRRDGIGARPAQLRDRRGRGRRVGRQSRHGEPRHRGLDRRARLGAGGGGGGEADETHETRETRDQGRERRAFNMHWLLLSSIRRAHSAPEQRNVAIRAPT